MVEEERTPNEVGWEALSPVERDRLTRMRRLLEVGWDNVIKYDEQSGLPPSEQRSWVIGVRGENKKGNLLLRQKWQCEQPSLVLRYINR